jgi:hypothetical protein
MDGEVMTALHQKLLLRELAQNGFPQAVYLPETGQIKVPVDEREHQPLLTANGSVLYWPEHRDIAMGTLRPIGERVKETVDAWNRTREMPVPDLAEFRVLAEYSNIVLAARDDTKSGYGLHFVAASYRG